VHTRGSSAPQYEDGKIVYKSKEEILRVLPRLNGLYQDN
jgi:hypothetical protein